MSSFLTPTQWETYRKLIRDAHDTFSQAEVTWYRAKANINRWGSDDTTLTFDTITLKALIIYNSFRIWPLTNFTQSGQLDQTAITLQLNNDWLEEQGYINSEGGFAFDPGKDRFVYQGIRYKAAGDTPVSQDDDKPLHTYVILQREEINNL